MPEDISRIKIKTTVLVSDNCIVGIFESGNPFALCQCEFKFLMMQILFFLDFAANDIVK